MELFYTDKSKLFECAIQVEGADIEDTRARMILMFENKRNLIFFGDVDKDGNCQISIPAIKDMKEGSGTAILEVISESTVFEPWESDFKLKASKKVTVEVKSSNKKLVERVAEVKKPRVTITREESPTNEEKDFSNRLRRKIKNAII